MKLPFNLGCMPDNPSFTPDIMPGSSRITLHGTQMIYIENFKAIIKYTPDEIIIKTGHNIIYLEGSNLKVDYYDSCEIKISGKIIIIKFEK
jgi:sporulation protein YqfC